MEFDFTEKPADPMMLAEVAPVLLKEIDENIKNNAVIITANAFLKQRSITLVDGEPKVPNWLKDCMNSHKNILVIEDVDSLSSEDQQNFYELLKYDQLSSVKLPIKTKILLTYKNLRNISQTIASLCLIVK